VHAGNGGPSEAAAAAATETGPAHRSIMPGI